MRMFDKFPPVVRRQVKIAACISIAVTVIQIFFSTQFNPLRFLFGTAGVFASLAAVIFLLIWPPFHQQECREMVLAKCRGRESAAGFLLQFTYSLVYTSVFMMMTAAVEFGSLLKAVNWIAYSAYASSPLMTFFKVWFIIFLGFFALVQFLPFPAVSLAAGATLFALSTVNYFKVIYRGQNLFPWDLRTIGVTAAVIGEYTFEIPWGVWLFALSLLALFLLSFRIPSFRQPLRVSVLLRRAVSIACCAAIVTALIASVNTVNRSDVWNPKKTKTGAVANFVSYVKAQVPSAPQGYSEAAVAQALEALRAAYPAATGQEAKTPDIIVVMSESFFDIESVNGITFEPSLLDSFHEIGQSNVSGSYLTPVFAGGTSNVEFEALTGFSSNFTLRDAVPYLQFVHGEYDSYVRYLKQLGYATTGFHPWPGENWSRETVYPLMGFDRFFDEDFFADCVKARFSYTDTSVIGRMLEEYERVAVTDQPQFFFLVTMLNHGGYGYYEESWAESGIPGAQFTTEQPISDKLASNVKEYATGLSDSDDSIRLLYDYFSEVERDVIVIYFGDHQPRLGDTPEQFYTDVALIGEPGVLDEYTSSYIAWSNHDQVQKENRFLSVNLMMPAILDSFGLPMPEFYRYLLQMQQVLPVYNLGVYMDPDGSLIEESQLTQSQKQWLDTCQLLQYDYMFGQKYAGSLFT